MLLVVADAIKMAECGLRSGVGGFGGVFAKVVNDGAGCRECLRVIVEAEAGEFGDTELFAENARGVVVLKGPVFDAAFDTTSPVEQRSFCGIEELLRARKKCFTRVKELEFFAKGFFGAGAAEFGGLKFSGRKIDEGEADDGCGGVLRNGGEEIVFAGVEDGDIGGRSGRNNADDFTTNEFLAGAGRFHLIADGDLEAVTNETRDVSVGGVIGNATHGNRLTFFAIAGRERDLEFTRGKDRVFVKKFVEIAETEKQQRVRVTRFDRVVLLHQRCSRVAHRGVRQLLFAYSQLRQQERVVESDFAEVVVAAGGAAVSCAHVDFEEKRIVVELQGAEFGDVFGGFPVHDLAVVESGLHEDGGIVCGGEICVGAIRLHVEIVGGDLRIAPFFVLADGQRERSVEHGVENVDEGNVADDDAEKIGAHVGDSAHEQTTGTSAFDG